MFSLLKDINIERYFRKIVVNLSLQMLRAPILITRPVALDQDLYT